MRLILLRSTCDIGRRCPNINATDRGTYLVQGYLMTDPDLGDRVLGSGESVVEIPSSLLPELAATRRPMVRFTARSGGRSWCEVASLWTRRYRGS
ncbi:MAG: hypothetical protein ACRDTF_12435 [Pseudonocardiaceae bacterium]